MEKEKHPNRNHKNPPRYKDDKGNLVLPIELVFPIVRINEDGKFEPVATGFFVHPAGGFVTAKHCLFENEVYDTNCFAIQTLSPGHHVKRKIQYFEPHPVADIGMGMLHGEVRSRETDEMILKAAFGIALKEPCIDDDVMTLAYPRMKIDDKQEGTFPCDRYTGQIIEHYPKGTFKLRSSCFRTNMEIKSGASGGPVLRANKIIGVNSTSFKTEENEEPLSFITPIHFLYELRLTDIDGVVTSVKELMENGHMMKAEF
jgi:hypothetical protein